jgi:hypothetical protein
MCLGGTIIYKYQRLIARYQLTSNSADEETGSAFDNDVYQDIELALCVVVIGLSGTASHLGKEEIDTKGTILIV